MYVSHPIAPVWSPDSRILVLGTMPSPASRAAGFYYMHPQNRFWPVLSAVLGGRLLYGNDGLVSGGESAPDGEICGNSADGNRGAGFRAAARQDGGRPQRFVAEAIAERRALVLRHKIALWDVLAGCEIRGAGDSSIRNPVPNDLSVIFGRSRVTRVFCTGQTAFRLYNRFCAEACDVAAVCLPSTSPANRGRWPFERLLEVYAVLNAPDAAL